MESFKSVFIDQSKVEMKGKGSSREERKILEVVDCSWTVEIIQRTVEL